MRSLTLLLWFALVPGSSLPARAADTRIIKVLPQYLDQKERFTISPSLFDRDAYQLRLRRHPEERSGLRFAVQWKAPRGGPLKVRVELRGAHGMELTTAMIEEPLQRHGLFSTWTAVKLSGEKYQQFGELVAWRVTLWDANQEVAQRQSFLW